MQGTEFTDKITLDSGLIIFGQSIGVATSSTGFDWVDGVCGYEKHSLSSTSSILIRHSNRFGPNDLTVVSGWSMYRVDREMNQERGEHRLIAQTDDEMARAPTQLSRSTSCVLRICGRARPGPASSIFSLLHRHLRPHPRTHVCFAARQASLLRVQSRETPRRSSSRAPRNDVPISVL